MRQRLTLALLLGACLTSQLRAQSPTPVRELPLATLEDKLRGGLLGQLLGNLNGLPHEMKYIAEPGEVEAYTPALPQGAWTDDDTDIEWVYVTAMQRAGTLRLPSEQITALWKRHINRGIWCANRYCARPDGPRPDTAAHRPDRGQPVVGLQHLRPIPCRELRTDRAGDAPHGGEVSDCTTLTSGSTASRRS